MNNWKLEYLLDLEPYEFEHLLGKLFSNMGYRAEVTQASKDTGIDIIISIENLGLSHVWLVQAKRYTEPIGVKQIREYSSLRYRDKVDGVIMVTTSTYTKDAYQEANAYNVKLIDGTLLLKMLEHYISLNNVPIISTSVHNSLENIVLKQRENVLGEIPVLLKGEYILMVCTNRRIFFIKEIKGVLSKKRDVIRTIDINEILGWSFRSSFFYLVLGGKKIEIIGLSIKKSYEAQNILECLQYTLHGEHMLNFEHIKNTFLILTNKRFIKIDSSSGVSNELMIKQIEGIEVKNGGLLGRSHLRLKKINAYSNLDIECNDINAWKSSIEGAIRNS